MASCQEIAEEEHFTRLILFLEKPCLKLMRALFHRRLQETNPGLSVDGFLHNNRRAILQTRHGKYNKDKYYSPGGSGTNTDKWDLGMLFHMTSYFTASHNNRPLNRIMDHLKDIKEMRDNLCHRGQPLVKRTEYDDCRKSIGDFITDTVTYLNDNSLKAMLQEDVEHIERPMATELIEIHTNFHNLYKDNHIDGLIEGWYLNLFKIY